MNGKTMYMRNDVLKHVFSIFFAMILAVCAMPGSIYAGTNGHTQQDAVNWVTARGNEKWCQDVDGAYGCQCVDLVLAYYKYLTGSTKSGNACDYRSNSLPSGWKRVSSPQAGDVVVWGPGAKMGWSPLSTEYANGTYGHIGIVWRVNSGGTISTVETNTLTGSAAAFKERYASSAACYIRPDFPSPHTHSYTASVTKQPTCTEKGVKTYKCSCGNSYTESIAATGHKYTDKVVAPTTSSKGYTKHTCSVCGYSFNDSYTDPITEVDGWMVTSVLPSDITSDKYEIQYKNYYEKNATASPGSGWTNAGTVKTEWKNSGSQYTSYKDLATSDSRVLVRSEYYHFCGPNAGNVGNYEQTGKFVHYDGIDAKKVTAKYLGDDEGHPYYFVYLNGEQLYCHSGTTCDGSYGTHGNRCRAWYKMNYYQDRVKVTTYKFTKESGWGASKDSAATKVTYRYRLKHTHSYTARITKEPTYDSEGVKTFTCSCGDSYTESIPALERPVEEDPVIDDPADDDPVIDDPANDDPVIDDPADEDPVIDDPADDDPVIDDPADDDPADEDPEDMDDEDEEPAHVHSYRGKVTKSPTYDKEGVITYTCSCGDSYTESIPVLERPVYEDEDYEDWDEDWDDWDEDWDYEEDEQEWIERNTPGKVTISKVSGGKKKITVKWNRLAKKTKSYQIEIKNKKTGKATKVKVKQGKNKKMSKTVKKLKKGTYTVRIRAINKIDGENLYGKWSKAKTVKVK